MEMREARRHARARDRLKPGLAPRLPIKTLFYYKHYGLHHSILKDTGVFFKRQITKRSNKLLSTVEENSTTKQLKCTTIQVKNSKKLCCNLQLYSKKEGTF